MSGNYYDEYKSMVNRIASEYKKKFYTVEREDIAQELWLWFASHPNKTQDWLSMEDRRDADKLFAKSLRNAALDYCVKEKARQGNYEVSDIFWYTKDFIKDLLPAILSDNWTKYEALSMGENRSTKSPSESGDWMAFASDVKVAFEKLSEQEQNLVFLFYGEEVDGQHLHQTAGDDSKTARATMMQANRALNKMIKSLGGFAPFNDNDVVTKKEEEDDLPELQ